MTPIYAFSYEDRSKVADALSRIKASPYIDYPKFTDQLQQIAAESSWPEGFLECCERINAERSQGLLIHRLKNCPIDDPLPDLGSDDPVSDKYRLKRTFIAEAFLALFARFLDNPLLSYKNRNNGDFFTDVVCVNRFRGKRIGLYNDGDLIYHNDRTALKVRADYITLLGLHCPTEDVVYTSFVNANDIREHLSDRHQCLLREPWYFTDFDDVSREQDPWRQTSENHAIILTDNTLRFQQTLTKPISEAPREVWEALLEFNNALIKANKYRHSLRTGDLLVFANQHGLHNRERMDVLDASTASKRWLLKTYSFRSVASANEHVDSWYNGIAGCAIDHGSAS